MQGARLRRVLGNAVVSFFREDSFTFSAVVLFGAQISRALYRTWKLNAAAAAAEQPVTH